MRYMLPKKDFDGWNGEKKKLEDTALDRLVFHEREIWWCSIGINLGDEQDGKNELFERPILVLRKFNSKICWALPITSQPKTGIYYHTLDYEGQTFSVILSQIRLVSVKRFRRLIRKISPGQFRKIKDKMVGLVKNVYHTP